MNDWQTLFPAGIVFAMLGGVLGALGAFEQGHGTLRRAAVEAAIAAVFAAAVAEHYLPLNKAWVCGGFGVGVGLIAGYLLDAVKALAPNITAYLLNAAKTLLPGMIRNILTHLAEKYAAAPPDNGKSDKKGKS